MTNLILDRIGRGKTVIAAAVVAGALLAGGTAEAHIPQACNDELDQFMNHLDARSQYRTNLRQTGEIAKEIGRGEPKGEEFLATLNEHITLELEVLRAAVRAIECAQGRG